MYVYYVLKKLTPVKQVSKADIILFYFFHFLLIFSYKKLKVLSV